MPNPGSAAVTNQPVTQPTLPSYTPGAVQPSTPFPENSRIVLQQFLDINRRLAQAEELRAIVNDPVRLAAYREKVKEQEHARLNPLPTAVTSNTPQTPAPQANPGTPVAVPTTPEPIDQLLAAVSSNPIGGFFTQPDRSPADVQQVISNVTQRTGLDDLASNVSGRVRTFLADNVPGVVGQTIDAHNPFHSSFGPDPDAERKYLQIISWQARADRHRLFQSLDTATVLIGEALRHQALNGTSEEDFQRVVQARAMLNALVLMRSAVAANDPQVANHGVEEFARFSAALPEDAYRHLENFLARNLEPSAADQLRHCFASLRPPQGVTQQQLVAGNTVPTYLRQIDSALATAEAGNTMSLAEAWLEQQLRELARSIPASHGRISDGNLNRARYLFNLGREQFHLSAQSSISLRMQNGIGFAFVRGIDGTAPLSATQLTAVALLLEQRQRALPNPPPANESTEAQTTRAMHAVFLQLLGRNSISLNLPQPPSHLTNEQITERLQTLRTANPAEFTFADTFLTSLGREAEFYLGALQIVQRSSLRNPAVNVDANLGSSLEYRNGRWERGAGFNNLLGEFNSLRDELRRYLAGAEASGLLARVRANGSPGVSSIEQLVTEFIGRNNGNEGVSPQAGTQLRNFLSQSAVGPATPPTGGPAGP